MRVRIAPGEPVLVEPDVVLEPGAHVAAELERRQKIEAAMSGDIYACRALPVHLRGRLPGSSKLRTRNGTSDIDACMGRKPGKKKKG